jgi:hypothetical protein
MRHVRLYSYLVDFEASPNQLQGICQSSAPQAKSLKKAADRNLRMSCRITVSPDVSLSRAVPKTYCQRKPSPAANGKRAVVFCSPPASISLGQTSSDTKRFTRTVREADSSTGWREDEQFGGFAVQYKTSRANHHGYFAACGETLHPQAETQNSRRNARSS